MNHILADGWSILPTEITTIQNNVWKVTTDSGTYALKRSELKEKNLHFICTAEQSLANNDFSRFALLIPTAAGYPYFTAGNESFTLHQWIEGEKCDLTKEDHLFAAAETLAMFHTAANEQRLRKHKSDRRDHFAHAEHIERRLKELRRFHEKASSSPSTAMTTAFLRDYPQIIAMARESFDRLMYSAYPRLLADAEEAGAFIHYDVAARNFIIREGNAFLIDFDYCCCDLQITDLVRLWKRSFKEGENYPKRIESILNGYQKHRHIGGEEFEVLYAMLLFPQKHWRLAHRYFTEKQRKDESFYVKKWHTANEEWNKEQIWLPLVIEKRRDLIESKTHRH